MTETFYGPFFWTDVYVLDRLENRMWWHCIGADELMDVDDASRLTGVLDWDGRAGLGLGNICLSMRKVEAGEGLWG